MSRVFVIHENGGPEKIVLEDREVGAPGPGEVKIRQTAVGLNFIDVYQRTGLYKLPMPFTPGNEGAGEIIAVGEGVADFRVGDRVGYTGALGAYAEERLVSADRLVRIPDGISDETVAASLLKGTTAQYLLFDTYPVKAGETILWHAAAGGVGLLGCQWANALGVHVIGTAGGPEKVKLARENGCRDVIDYKSEDYVARVREITGGKGVDVVYDSVGKETFERSLDCLRPRGLMVSFGNASGPVSVPNLGILANKGSLFLTRPTSNAYTGTGPQLRRAAGMLFDAILAGKVKVAINQRFPLKDAAEAHRALEARETTGSTVLLP